MAPRPSKNVVIAAAAVLFGVAILVLPMLVVAMTRGTLNDTGCGEHGRPPASAFFRSIDRLDAWGRVPWVRGAAQRATNTAALRCVEHFAARCSTLRDDAVDAAREVVSTRMSGAQRGRPTGETDAGQPTQPSSGSTDWRRHIDAPERDRLCLEWDEWTRWLADEGHDPRAACALCEPALQTL